MRLRLLLLFSVSIVPTSLEAAPCCATAGAVPSLITGDERASFQASLSEGSVIGDAPAAGGGVPVFRDALSARENRSSLVVSAATLIDGDRLQAGISLPLQWNRTGSGSRNASNAAFGDVSLTLGHETFPEWEYSLWKPRGFSFFQLTLPTGRSVFESRDALLNDVTGLGAFQAALGMVFMKRWSLFDLSSVLKAGRVFGREFADGLRMTSAWSGSLGIGAGWSFAERFRLGGTLQGDYLSPFSGGSQRLVWTGGANLTWLSGADDSFILGYADQTLFGPALNTTLSRTVSVSFVHRVER
jgi:hypothetical protein